MGSAEALRWIGHVATAPIQCSHKGGFTASRKTILLLATVVGAFAVLASRASGTTYRPNKTGDHAPNGCTQGDCTVREALNRGNAHSGADTIVLRGGKVYNVTLNPSNIEDSNAAADLDVNDDLTIKRSGRGFAVLDAHGLNRVLDVGPAGSVSAKLENIWSVTASAPMAPGSEAAARATLPRAATI